MALLGPDGHPITEVKDYKVGSFGIQTSKSPEFFLQIALKQAVDTWRQHDPLAAAQIKNPFQMEPGAQALFMLVADALKAQDERIAELEAKLAGDAEGSPDGSSS